MKIQIVDKNDVGISNKERDEIDYSTDIYRVSALWLTNNKEDETYEVNTSKEAQEEIGLSAVHFDEAKKRLLSWKRGRPVAFCKWYQAVVDMPIVAFTRQVSEVAALARIIIKLHLPSLPWSFVRAT
jgi:hypothetical protein